MTGKTSAPKEKATASEHAGHRQRMRQKFAQGGFAGFHDYEVLEFLLFFVFRQGDTKPVAKALLKACGSFSAVLDAPVETLAAVKGMGADSAIALKALRNALTYYFTDSVKAQRIQLTTMSQLVDYLRALLGDKQNEVLIALQLNARNEIIATAELGEGTVSQAAAYPRRIVEEVLKQRATSVILAHNHPGGVAAPSDDDIRITSEIKQALQLVEVSLQEHIILAGNEYYAFSREGYL